MDDLGADITAVARWLSHEQNSPYVFVRLTEKHVADFPRVLRIPVRRCYVDEASLDKNSLRTGKSKADLLAAKLPDRGSTMAGDFGEILVFFYHAVRARPDVVIGPKKWRLKQDRRKPAPYSDVIHFVVPSWPQASDRDSILCSEVKTKSTPGGSAPVAEAIADSKKDRTSRLAKTLVWLRERALTEDLGTVTVAHLERFINLTDHPVVRRHFRAVAVVCASFVDDELGDAPYEAPTDCEVVVISVPNLKECYEGLFNAVHEVVADGGSSV